MKCNMGSLDRLSRIIAAIAIGIAGYMAGIWWLYLIALLPLMTSVFGYCPLYTALKVSTCKECLEAAIPSIEEKPAEEAAPEAAAPQLAEEPIVLPEEPNVESAVKPKKTVKKAKKAAKKKKKR